MNIEQSGSSMRNEIGKMILCISVARAPVPVNDLPMAIDGLSYDLVYHRLPIHK